MHKRHNRCLRGLLILLVLAIIATSCSEEKCTNTCGGDGSGSGIDLRDSVRIDDLDFVRNKYFFIVYPYNIDYGPDQDPNIFTDVEVYLDDGFGTNNEAAVHAYAFMDPTTDAAQEPQTGWDSLDCAFEGDFDVLTPNTHYVIDPRTGEIVLLTPLGATHTLAVRYTHGNSSESETVGGYMPDSLALKMIRPADEEMFYRWAIWKEALKLERKNVYSLQTRYIPEEEVEVTIYRKGLIDEHVQHEHEYSKILGIDLADEHGRIDTVTWATDGYADGGRVNGEFGLLLFPDLRPFDPDLVVSPRPEALDSLNRNSVIYDVHYTYLVPPEAYSKFYMVIRFTSASAAGDLHKLDVSTGSGAAGR